ncbi:MAG: hypothetical protein ACJ72R_00120 [Nitrososphaeraceae archaeon]
MQPASILAATIALSTFAGSAYAVGNTVSNRQSLDQSAQANDNGLAGIAANVGVGANC